MADDNLSTASGPILVQKKVTKENVTVCVRVRPLNRLEQRTGQKEAWTIDPRTQSITQSHFPNELAKKASQTKEIPSFAFDYVFTPDQDNLYVYDKIGFPLVLSVMEGFHGCVFAYGQTSSGKTHTIHGSPTAPGMIPQAIETVFGYIEEHSEREFVLRVSYMEIYNEIVNDLLNPANTNLRIREDVKRGVFVEGLKEDIVMTDDQVFSLLQAGTSHRHIGRTNYNDVSSRSHTVFRVVIESSPRGKARGGVRVSTLNLVDLAGSENAVKAGSDARVKETGYINKSLLTLGHVIFKLSENNLEHIPYRDSKLTRILQSSLSGKSKISVVCNVSPSSGNIEESLSTLKFAARAKKIVNNATVNERLDSETLLRKYRDEIDQLKRELLEAREASKVSAESKLRDEETYALMEKNEQEKMALNAKIEQLTRLILTSSQARPIIQEPLAPPEAAAAPDAPSPTASGPETSRSTDSTAPSITISDSSEGSTPASTAAASVEKPKPNATLRLPGRSSGGKSATIYGTLPRGFNLANVPMARRHSLKDMQKAIDELVRRSGGDDDLDCPVPAPAVISADADPNDTVESLRAKLAKVSQDLKVTKAQLEESKQQNEILQRELEEKNTLLQEWDTYYVTNSNKTSAITNELRRVAAKTNNDELRELFHSLDMDQDDFNAPLVDLSSGGLTSSTSEQTLARPPSGTQKTPDRNKFMGLMSRWKSIEQDMDK